MAEILLFFLRGKGSTFESFVQPWTGEGRKNSKKKQVNKE
jgi:hypothetical protein